VVGAGDGEGLNGWVLHEGILVGYAVILPAATNRQNPANQYAISMHPEKHFHPGRRMDTAVLIFGWSLTLMFRSGAAVCARQKMDQKWTLSEPKASFVHFPFFAAHKREPVGQRLRAGAVLQPFFCLLFL